MKKSELIEKCYKEMNFNGQLNPQSMEQIVYAVTNLGGETDFTIALLMARYIDAQEEE